MIWRCQDEGIFSLHRTVSHFCKKETYSKVFFSFSFHEYFRSAISIDGDNPIARISLPSGGAHRGGNSQIGSNSNARLIATRLRRTGLIRDARAAGGAIKSRANADLKLQPARRHYRIASLRITAAFPSYLSYPRQECNTAGNRTPQEGWHADTDEALSRTRVPYPRSHDDASARNVRAITLEEEVAYDLPHLPPSCPLRSFRNRDFKYRGIMRFRLCEKCSPCNWFLNFSPKIVYLR